MHPVLKKIYGDSKFRYDAIADPHGGKWAVLKEYLKRYLDPASFRTVWKAMCYAPATLQNACKASSIRSAYHNTGIIDQNKLIEIQNGVDTNPSNPRTILGVNPFFNKFTREDGEYMLAKIDEFAEITARYGYIPEDDYAKVLMGKTYLDNCPLLKPGAKPLNDMVTNRQRNLVMSNGAFVEQSLARAETMKMASADRESREVNLKVYRPADKLAALQKKKEEKSRIEIEVAEAKRAKEEAKEEAKKQRINEKNVMKRRREEEKGANKTNKRRITPTVSYPELTTCSLLIKSSIQYHASFFDDIASKPIYRHIYLSSYISFSFFLRGIFSFMRFFNFILRILAAE